MATHSDIAQHKKNPWTEEPGERVQESNATLAQGAADEGTLRGVLDYRVFSEIDGLPQTDGEA